MAGVRVGTQANIAQADQLYLHWSDPLAFAQRTAMGKKIHLEVVEPEMGRDCIVAVTEAGFPILKGDDHAACGACSDVLAWNLSPEKLCRMFRVVYRLLLLCRCGAHNLV